MRFRVHVLCACVGGGCVGCVGSGVCGGGGEARGVYICMCFMTVAGGCVYVGMGLSCAGLLCVLVGGGAVA